MGKLVEVIYRISVDRENIGLINAIFEAYEEVAIVRVVDKKESIMEIYTSCYFRDVVEEIIESLKKEYGIRVDVLDVFEEQIDL